AVDTDLGKAEEAVRVALKTVPEVVQDPAPEVLVKKLGDFTIDFEIRIWTPAPQSEMLRVNSEATCAVKEAFDSLGIDMPFPTQVMYVHREAVTRNDEEIPPGAD
ncbi:MAG: mechanosensitive ion channel, partial [Armatimonadetes bacterium]|nr:mechanosensitive ion channel [Armatimonadota bacterium]